MGRGKYDGIVMTIDIMSEGERNSLRALRFPEVSEQEKRLTVQSEDASVEKVSVFVCRRVGLEYIELVSNGPNETGREHGFAMR